MSGTALVLLALCVGVVRSEFTDIPGLIITQHPEGGAVPYGERYDFTCVAETSPDKTVEYSWARITDLDSLNPVMENLDTDETGSEGIYIEYNAQTSAFYFCIVTSDSFKTTSNGAYLEVAYLEDFASDGGPAPITYTESRLYIELQCQVPNSNPYPEVQWYKYGVKYSAENTILQRDSEGQPSNLIIFDLTVDDSGTYYCEVTNEGAEKTYRTDSAFIEIGTDAVTMGEYPPVEVVPSYNVEGYEAGSITLYAGVASKPQAEYEWALNNAVITTGGRYTIKDYGRALVITDLSAEDEGSYIVSYKLDGVLEGTTNIRLGVILTVKSDGDIYDYATVSGEDLELDCGCVGSPPDWLQYAADSPGTRWFKDGVLLENGTNTEVYVTVNLKRTGKALIRSVNSEGSGTYSCNCFNHQEFKTFTKNVFVADERQALTIAADKEGWGLVGSTVSIACQAEGIPRPIIEWYKGGNLVVEGVFPRDDGFRIEYERSMFKTIGYLVVDNAEWLDSGVFECKASHTVREVEYNLTTTAVLSIARPTSCRIQCLNTTVEEGKTATIVCGVSGVPLPTVSYTKINATDDSLIELEEGFGTVNNLSYLIIPNVRLEDAGMYRGDATNVATGGFLARFDTLMLTVTPTSSRMSMNKVIGLSVLVAFLLLGGLVAIILFGRWRRESAFKAEMKRLIKDREVEVSEMQQRLQLRSMEHRLPAMGNPLHQLPETRRQLPSFYAANIAVMAAAPGAKFLPPSLADLKKRKLMSTSVIHEDRSVSPSSVKTTGLSDVEN